MGALPLLFDESLRLFEPAKKRAADLRAAQRKTRPFLEETGGSIAKTSEI
jgi:hypothetical protein